MESSSVRIGTPCDLDWKKMTPADKGRFCAECKKVVRDLSGMSKREAKEMLSEARSGELCVRYMYDANGAILFASEGLVRASLLRRSKATIAAAALAVPLAATACSDGESFLGMGGGGGVVMGEMVAYEPDAATDKDAGDADRGDAKDDNESDAKPLPRSGDVDAGDFDDAEVPTVAPRRGR